jgi:hypothetical protein
MNTLADLHRAVQPTLASKRLGTPVFVRYLYHATIAGPAVTARLARTVTVVRDWLGQPLDRVYALGGVNDRHITLTLECRGGATALVSWVGAAGRGPGVDLMVLGNHGAIYHDAGTAELWDEAMTAGDEAPDREVLALIEQALRSHRPEAAER